MCGLSLVVVNGGYFSCSKPGLLIAVASVLWSSRFMGSRFTDLGSCGSQA